MKILLLTTALLGAVAVRGGTLPVSTPAFVSGEPVILVFEYDGSLKGWFGKINVPKNRAVRSFGISNMDYFIVTRGKRLESTTPHVEGLLAFARGQGEQYWEPLARAYGAWVEPLEGLGYWLTQPRLNESFRTVVELSRFYDLSEPGTYNVYWGTQGVFEGSVEFEILSRSELE